MIGRRVAAMTDIERPGDYFGPARGWTGEALSVFFLLPTARDAGAPAEQRVIHHVDIPPHTYRECADGSLELRASIGAEPWWHGYLDEGHSWRGVGRWADK